MPCWDCTLLAPKGFWSDETALSEHIEQCKCSSCTFVLTLAMHAIVLAVR